MQIRKIVDEFLSSGFIFSEGIHDIWIGFGKPIRSSQADFKKPSIYSPDFFLKDQSPWWIFPEVEELDRADLVLALREYLFEDQDQSFSENLIRSVTWIDPEFALFQEILQGIKNQFDLGVLKKCVPVLFSKAQLKLTPKLKAALLIRLLNQTRHFPLYLYGVWGQEEGILGATPEILFQKNTQNMISTAALAGTQIKEDSPVQLLKDPKEMEEHRIVIDGICTSLAGFGQVKIGQTQTLELPSLTHLYTPITISEFVQFSRNELFEKLVNLLHPTPALGAFPKEAGKKWLESQERKESRYRFGAPFGWIGIDGELRCLVSIRNIQWHSNTVLVGAGCGIVPMSQSLREWQEVKAKIHTVKKLFGFTE